jgi:hypothetical protein
MKLWPFVQSTSSKAALIQVERLAVAARPISWLKKQRGLKRRIKKHSRDGYAPLQTPEAFEN